MTAYGLIDTTEMYLRTVFELEEEGVVPLRARIAERLHQSGPTVSQTVARMERDGLMAVHGDRHLELTQVGHTLAKRVMRKHRLAECLLLDVIGLDWEQVHVEACRWEHVMSDDVESRLVQLLERPDTCPHGNPIPGLGEFDGSETAGEPSERPAGLTPLREFATEVGRAGVVSRISEQVQSDVDLMTVLSRAGVRPGRTVQAVTERDGVLVRSAAGAQPDHAQPDPDAGQSGGAELSSELAGHVFIVPC